MKIPTWLVKFVSDIYIHSKPFYIVYKPAMHKVKGEEVRKILNILKPGDIVLRRHEVYLSSIFLPVTWTHTGLYVGDNKIAHTMKTGTVEEDVLNFLRTDNVAVVRIKESCNVSIDDAINYARNIAVEGIEYDYEFEDDNGKLYCTELINDSFNKIFDDDMVDVAGYNVLLPDDVYESSKVDKIY